MKRVADAPIAALTMFTKIPLWKFFPDIPGEAYSKVVTWWPYCGWLTGTVYAGMYWLLSFVLPSLPSAIIAYCARIALTGGYHEDGLADFADGFGGGKSKASILSIMKDSHIGTYGVIALVMYIGVSISILSSLPAAIGALMIICADPWSKFSSGRMLSFLNYARVETSAKNLAAYPRPGFKATVIALCGALIPMIAVMVYCKELLLPLICSAGVSALVCALLIRFMKRKIEGYTGDCCGAVCLMCETSFCIIFSIMFLNIHL